MANAEIWLVNLYDFGNNAHDLFVEWYNEGCNPSAWTHCVKSDCIRILLVESWGMLVDKSEKSIGDSKSNHHN